jgi:hypothetical protein
MMSVLHWVAHLYGHWRSRRASSRVASTEELRPHEVELMKACRAYGYGACECPRCLELFDYLGDDGMEHVAPYCTSYGHDLVSVREGTAGG